MGFSHTFNWPADPNVRDVYVTGSFDNWSKSSPMVQNVDGSWTVSIPLPDEKITYKFVVNDNWVVDPKAKKEVDASGIENNVLDPKELVSTQGSGSVGFIPESGGIPIVSGKAAGETNSKDVGSASKDTQFSEPEVRAAVMPQPANIHEPFLNTPGIVLPASANEINEFQQVPDTEP
ncbi:immunoglobulin E-set, partial [Dipodascopsis uninucleata]